MPISYTNRKGETYYVRTAKSKNGVRYYAIKSLPKADEIVNKMPEGFSFYEFPTDARVMLCKTKVSIITDKEFSIVDSAMKKVIEVDDYIIEKKENALILYISDQNIILLKEMWVGTSEAKLRDILKKFRRYDERMRFIKADDYFEIQRFCYLGSVDDWITIDAGNDLKKLAEKYCDHIDKESFYELFWGGQ